MLAPVFRHTPILEFILIEHRFWFSQPFCPPPCGSNFLSAKFPISLEYSCSACDSIECPERIEKKHCPFTCSQLWVLNYVCTHSLSEMRTLKNGVLWTFHVPDLGLVTEQSGSYWKALPSIWPCLPGTWALSSVVLGNTTTCGLLTIWTC